MFELYVLDYVYGFVSDSCVHCYRRLKLKALVIQISLALEMLLTATAEISTMHH